MVKNPTAKQWALRNPFWAPDPKDTESADYELRRHLLPTVTLQPSGIFAVMRAQVAGCH